MNKNLNIRSNKMNRLREARFKKRKSQIQLFKETGIWPSRISYIENGYMRPHEEEEIRISNTLGFERSWLFPKENHL
jgi:transcriptional regulator with XRE-family HTH domain